MEVMEADMEGVMERLVGCMVGDLVVEWVRAVRLRWGLEVGCWAVLCLLMLPTGEMVAGMEGIMEAAMVEGTSEVIWVVVTLVVGIWAVVISRGVLRGCV
jgi:hypothetical protein